MKKLVLIIICTLIMVIFIGFNYLLWDRENREKDIQALQVSNANDNMTIDNLNRQLINLDEDNRQLTANIKGLNDKNNLLINSKSMIEVEIISLSETLKQKNIILNKLMQGINPDIFKESVIKWAKSIDKGEYKAAYELQYDMPLSKETYLSLDEFTNNYKATVKHMKIKSIKLFMEGLPETRLGDIILDVVLDVTCVDNPDADKSKFTEGLNERYFTIVYDSQRKDWVILSLSDKL